MSLALGASGTRDRHPSYSKVTENELSGWPQVGTADALERIERYLRARLNVLLLGQRGSGKTALLSVLADSLKAKGRQVYVVTAGEIRDADGFIELLLHQLEEDGWTVPASSVGPDLTQLAIVLSNQSGLEQVVFLVDDLAPVLAHTVFGRLRDEVWGVPANWVVSARSKDVGAFLLPPADAFFETRVLLGPIRSTD